MSLPTGTRLRTDRYEGSVEFNSADTTQLVIAPQGEGEPVEVTRIERQLRASGADSIETGAWLSATRNRSAASERVAKLFEGR